MDALSDSWIDYHVFLPTHGCECGGSHMLRSYPVDGGWVVAVCCDTCRDATGLPRRYSTETDEPFLTFDQAECSRKALLRFRGDFLPPKPKPVIQVPPNEKYVYLDKHSGRWLVELKRRGKRIKLGKFKEQADAILARDEFLEKEAA